MRRFDRVRKKRRPKGQYYYVYGTRRSDGKVTFLGPYNRFDAEEVLERMDSDSKIIPMSTSDYKTAKSRFKEGRFREDGESLDIAMTPIRSSL